ncbi:MAG: carboxymuconolactone decarboxylase family protein [Bacteroidales bacterium]|nr:carboxymuconolactone decarboxylase family protein [Bacteroidales bacterium]
MKSIFLFLMTVLITTTTMAQTLTDRQKALAACAALEAQGDLVRLETVVIDALERGVTINELKEVFSQLYAYTGFPRSLNALGVLQKVIATPKAQWKEGKPFERPILWDNAAEALKVGTEIQTKLSGQAFDFQFCPQDDYYLKSHLFGDIFAGNQLTPADREIVTVAALSAMKGVEPQLAAHKRGTVNMGNTQQQVDELCTWLDKEGYTLKSDFAKGANNVAYAQYFTGESYLNPLSPANLSEGEKTVLPMSNVTFEPGCRNNWHIHHGVRQILICVSGRGWYQEWGKPAIPMTAGTVIDIPEGVKHWHGAASDSWFQHIATHVKVADTESNEWLEPVSDEQYEEVKKQ